MWITIQKQTVNHHYYAKSKIRLPTSQECYSKSQFYCSLFIHEWLLFTTKVKKHTVTYRILCTIQYSFFQLFKKTWSSVVSMIQFLLSFFSILSSPLYLLSSSSCKPSSPKLSYSYHCKIFRVLTLDLTILTILVWFSFQGIGFFLSLCLRGAQSWLKSWIKSDT